MLKDFDFVIQVRRSIQFFLDNLLSQTPDQQQTLAAIGEVRGDLIELTLELLFVHPNGMKPSFDTSESDLFRQDLFAIAQDQPFRFPSTFTFVIRAFSTLEGSLCHPISPSFAHLSYLP